MRRKAVLWSPTLLVAIVFVVGSHFAAGNVPFLGFGPAPAAQAPAIGAPESASRAALQPSAPASTDLPATTSAGGADEAIEPVEGERAPRLAAVDQDKYDILEIEPPAASEGSGAPPVVLPPEPAAPSSRSNRKPQRIGLQAGHWRSEQHADELAKLRASTGAEGPGWTEMAINLDIARRVERLLTASGYLVDLLPASVPIRYEADVFLSLHGDANSNRTMSGFKVARAVRSAIPKIDDALVASVYRQYGALTGMPRHDTTITSNMLYYYAFAGSRIQHAVAPTTPAAILEMGFLTNSADRALLTGSPDLIAQAVANGLIEFLSSR